jgi:phosphomevalonate kinase
MAPRLTVVSAPGKVLVAGGYLVLDPAYSGLVIATSSRFYCCASNTQKSTFAGDADGRSDAESMCLLRRLQ